MPQMVHVVAPSGERHERTFSDKVTPEQILAWLRSPEASRQIGYTGAVVKKDKAFGQNVPHADKTSPLIMDHPDTIVCVGHEEGGEFIEDKRIAGPPAEKPKKED